MCRNIDKNENKIDKLLLNFKKIYHQKINYPTKKFFGYLDIRGDYAYPSCALSNCAKKGYVYSFKIDDIECKCMEAFLQSLKCCDVEKQKYICSLNWREAQKEGRAINWRINQKLYWKGETIDRLSEEYQKLLDRAYIAIFEQNEEYRKALIDSGKLKLTHSIGAKSPKETVLTEDEFCSRLNKLRNILYEKTF